MTTPGILFTGMVTQVSEGQGTAGKTATSVYSFLQRLTKTRLY